MRQIDRLRQKLLVIARLNSAEGLLGWDENVGLPPKGQNYRGEVLAQLSGELHKLSTNKEFVGLIRELHKPASIKSLSADEQVIVREVWRDVHKATKLPQTFVEDFSKLTSQAFNAWTDARQKSKFSIFKPYLEKIVAMSRQQAEFFGYQDSPYDALLDGYEPGLTVKRIDSLFTPLVKELKPLIKQASQKTQPRLPKATYDLLKQEQLNRAVAQALGFDFDAGRLDSSPHPFTAGFHPTDVRITTRYKKDNLWESLGPTIHETGHGLYEQGLPVREFGTPLGYSVSLGIHESQSRIWENFVGKSRQFIEYLHPILIEYFGKNTIMYSADDLYRVLNRVEPSFIRVEADEVTYNLHIVLRFELERDLIEGKLNVADVPQAWNKKVKDYLGLEVPDDTHGCLQDVQWAYGFFGYFPTYALGNLYSAQLYHKISEDIPDVEKAFAKGDFSQFLGWLRREIHAHGRRYQPEELLERATGEPLNPQYLIDHLKTKINLR